jgi:actin-related protein 8
VFLNFCTKVELKYGCGDLNIALCNLMAQGAVPISLDLKCMWDMEFLSRLKERLCHLDLNRCGPELQKVVWDKPNGPPVKYNVNFGDELLIVPLSYFNPDLLRASISNNVVKVHRSQQSAPDDPFDAAYVTETSVWIDCL